MTWLQDVKSYDFVWASPPCKTHSKWNMVWSSRRENHPKPDPTLWFLIREFRALGINFVVENVDPYYKDPCDPTIKIGRHQFWTSFPIKKFDFISREKPFDQMTTRDWQQYHQLETIEGKAEKKRQALRNCTHWSIAAKIFEQFLEPKILSIKHFLQKEDLNK